MLLNRFSRLMTVPIWHVVVIVLIRSFVIVSGLVRSIFEEWAFCLNANQSFNSFAKELSHSVAKSSAACDEVKSFTLNTASIKRSI